MAWTPQSDYAAVNATLKADPRYAAALQRYSQTLRANPTPTIAQQRQDDTGAGGDANAADAVTGGQAGLCHDGPSDPRRSRDTDHGAARL